MILASPPREALVGSRAVELQVLGGFRLRCDDDELRLTETAQRVVALLAVRGQPLRRIHVAGVLWPDVTHERSIGSLRSVVWAHFSAFRDRLAATLGARPTADLIDLVNRLRARMTPN